MRTPLTKERVLTTAVEIADSRGIGALTMRSLATALGVKPMSLYHHVANKDAILDGVVDLVFAQIDLPAIGRDWRVEMRRHAQSARTVLKEHPWALSLLESRTSPGPATLTHHDAVLGTLRAGGLSLAQTARAYAVLDAYVYGFVLQEVAMPFDSAGEPDQVADVADAVMEGLGEDDYPHLVEFATGHLATPGYSFAAQFDVGLDLILQGLAEPGQPETST